MEIPRKVRKELDQIYEAQDNQDYVVDYKGQYLPKKGNVFAIRHYHHIDRNRKNNNLWNLIPLSYDDHINKLESPKSRELQEEIYNFMIKKYPEHKEHYKKHLMKEGKL